LHLHFQQLQYLPNHHLEHILNQDEQLDRQMAHLVQQ